MANVRRGALAGYDHQEVVNISFELMCRVELWDYPVLFWLERLLSSGTCLVDAGGHMGTKYRAFRKHLKLDEQAVDWIIYDVPNIVKAGRERARLDELPRLSFLDDISTAPPADILLASGLLQYLDVPFPELLAKMAVLPRHLILNKVATRAGATIVTLENFGTAEVPYHIRNGVEFVESVKKLGYVVVDEWTIPSLSHTIGTHPKLGSSTSRGFYLTLQASE